ncbi:serine protease [Polaromonas sp.]|uniref:S1 family peptidase n=1 Tax=Polaromonas sp. TaxID=1869339 RepID=UPI0018257B06|nr:serine protease [Polaromonas sp.]NMM07090.1 trypsin-like peptidase domain-containing protein [Polaromonas sp.]
MLGRKSSEGTIDVIGSAFLCHAKGYLLTCAHSINLTDQLCFIPPLPIDQFNPSHLERVNAISVTVAQYDAVNDAALLRIAESATALVPANLFGDEDQTPVGASICYLGFPYAHSGQHALKVSGGVISSKVISAAGTKQFQFDAMVEAGNSGGPLIDVGTGQIIGIVSGRFSPTGNGGGIRIGNHALGTESTISYATAIRYGLQLMKSEGLNG